jgi:hypothetical protein
LETEKKKVIRKKEGKVVIINEDVKDITGEIFNQEFGEKTPVSLTVLDPVEVEFLSNKF